MLRSYESVGNDGKLVKLHLKYSPDVLHNGNFAEYSIS